MRHYALLTILILMGCADQCYVDFDALDTLRHKVKSAFLDRNAEELLEMMNKRSTEDIELLQGIIDGRMQSAKYVQIPDGAVSSDKIQLHMEYGNGGRDTMIIYFGGRHNYKDIKKIDYIYGGGFMRTIG